MEHVMSLPLPPTRGHIQPPHYVPNGKLGATWSERPDVISDVGPLGGHTSAQCPQSASLTSLWQLPPHVADVQIACAPSSLPSRLQRQRRSWLNSSVSHVRNE